MLCLMHWTLNVTFLRKLDTKDCVEWRNTRNGVIICSLLVFSGQFQGPYGFSCVQQRVLL